MGRLKRLLKNLDQKQEVRETYDSVTKDQLENNIMEEFTNTEIINTVEPLIVATLGDPA